MFSAVCTYTSSNRISLFYFSCGVIDFYFILCKQEKTKHAEHCVRSVQVYQMALLHSLTGVFVSQRQLSCVSRLLVFTAGEICI